MKGSVQPPGFCIDVVRLTASELIRMLVLAKIGLKVV